jgi:hypothetical protein
MITKDRTMRTLTLTRYTDLTPDQWRRVAATTRRHVRRVCGVRCEVGIGRKWSSGRPRGNGVAIRVYLPDKQPRVPASCRVPDEFSIRLRRNDGRYELLQIPSDVDSLADLVPTAGSVALNNQSATTALVLRWVDHRRAIRWGFVTVAHLFDRRAPRAVSVRVRSTVFRCRRLRPPPRSDRNDVCILAVNGPGDRVEARLIDSGVLSPEGNRPVDLMSVRQVHRSVMNQEVGRTVSVDGSGRIVGEEVFPDGFRLGTRRVDDCVRVSAATENTFRPGTSGACWTFASRVACMQLGGRRPEFREGIGQPISRYLPWLRRTLGEQAAIVAVLDGVARQRGAGRSAIVASGAFSSTDTVADCSAIVGGQAASIDGAIGDVLT